MTEEKKMTDVLFMTEVKIMTVEQFLAEECTTVESVESFETEDQLMTEEKNMTEDFLYARNPISINGLEVYPDELPYLLSPSLAQEACRRKNAINSCGYSDWRVPNILELEVIYEKRHEVFWLENGRYLSSQIGYDNIPRRPGEIGRRKHRSFAIYFNFATGKVEKISYRPEAHFILVRGRKF